TWPQNIIEGDYNRFYATDPSYLVLDTKFYQPKGQSKIEVADLFHVPTSTLIAVKKLAGASSMSHLFAQAYVSADMLKDGDDGIWKFLLEQLQAKKPDLNREQMN